MKTSKHPTQDILRHWREAVPDDRLAHLVKDATVRWCARCIIAWSSTACRSGTDPSQILGSRRRHQRSLPTWRG